MSIYHSRYLIDNEHKYKFSFFNANSFIHPVMASSHPVSDTSTSQPTSKGPRYFWFDPNFKESSENHELQKKLELNSIIFNIYETDDACSEAIKQVPENAKVCLVVSGQAGEKFVPACHEMVQVSAIYVYCGNVETHEKWAQRFKKVSW